MYQEYETKINEILVKNEIQTSITLLQPPSLELGDFCFVVNRVSGKNDPIEFGNKLKDFFVDLSGIHSITLFNTAGESGKKGVIYLNFTLDENMKISLMQNQIQSNFKNVNKKSYGTSQLNTGKTAVVEHTSANPISPIHVGNLRNSIQGDTYARILKSTGYKIHRLYYVNDVGLQISLVAIGYEITKNLNIKPVIKVDLHFGQIYAIMNCFYSIDQIKRKSKNKQNSLSKGYQFTESDISILQDEYKAEIQIIQSKIDTITVIDKASNNQKKELRDLKRDLTKLEDESKNIEKYDRIFYNLKGRFPKLFHPLLEEVSKLDLDERQKTYLYSFEKNTDKYISSIFRELVSWNLGAFEWTLGRYNIEFDQFDYESDLTWSGKADEVIDQLAKSPNIVAKEGKALRYSYPSEAMAEFSKKTGRNKNSFPIKGQIPDLQLRRADGTALYPAKDIAYSIQKFEEFKPDVIYNVISTEQTLPQFQLLLPLFELGKVKYAKNLFHYSYDRVDLKGRTMSGRMAQYITADDYYNETFIRARIAKRDSDEKRGKSIPVTDEEWEEENLVLHAITLASTRFPLIESSPKRRIELDLDRELDFNRNSGPFIQYAHARANSILIKAEKEFNIKPSIKIDFNQITDIDVLEISDHLMLFEEKLNLAADTQDPSQIATWCFQLAQYLMKYYEKYPVLKLDEVNIVKARLFVIAMIKKGINVGLTTLGIPAVDRL
ncbi:MAG: arginine--tRNA ligase [Candidatus Heimdallarchaeota archaeon]|nr:arginine--tRNA ligase [Candidatus Heimdallarchaeota archaeon]